MAIDFVHSFAISLRIKKHKIYAQMITKSFSFFLPYLSYLNKKFE